MRSLLILVCVLGLVSVASAKAPPNVLVIVTDDQGYGDLARNGNKNLKTPHLDRFAEQAVRLERFYVSPLCAPTRASLLTGRYSLRTGVTGVSAGAETMRAEETTLAEVLKERGYRTGLFGKWHNGEHFPTDPRGQGFDSSFGYNVGHWGNYFDTTLLKNGTETPTKGFLADVITDEAIGFLKQKSDKPFLCWLSLPTPHSPFQVPDKYFDRHKKLGETDRLSCIHGMIENLDDNIGRVLKLLDDNALSTDTIVVFLSDNGPNGERYNSGMRGAKGSYDEGGSRVPCYLRYPAKYKPREVTCLAAHIDLLPTLVELCGAKLPKNVDGRSLVPLLEGRTEGWAPRTLFTQHQRTSTSGAVRTDTHRLVFNKTNTALYDMTTDPEQKKNISTQQPELVKQLRKDFDTWYADVSRGASDDPKPIPLGHPEADLVELPAALVRFNGGVKFNGKHANNAWLIGWTSTDSTAEWTLEAVREGHYTVDLRYLCAKEHAGSTVAVKIGGAELEAKVLATPVVQLPSPDRVPREEAYEMEWHTLPMGKLTIPKGGSTLRMVPKAVANGSAIELKAIRLTRLSESK
jgi:arylsulfatase A-like enzyme